MAAFAVVAMLLSGCAVAMLGGAARSGGSGTSTSSGGDPAASRPASAGGARSGSSGSASSGTAGSAAGKSQAASDSSISTSVRSRLGASPALKTLKIVVDTHDGVVTLRGQVNTVEQRVAAQSEARAVNGVKGVNNQLTVR